MDHYGVLGVDADASPDEITRAYRDLAKAFHPDQHPGASAAAQARYGEAMGAINHAYNVLKDPARRRDYDATLAEAHADDTRRRPVEGECVLCGHGPAEEFEFSYQNAWLIRATRYTQGLSMCGPCALCIGRSHQNRTLMTGWWGVFSFFRNLAVVFTNARELHRAAKLAPPRPVPDVVAPLPTPLDAGRPVFARCGLYVTIAAFAMLGAMGAADQEETSVAAAPTGQAGGIFGQQTSSGGGIYADAPSTEEPDAGWAVGACVQGPAHSVVAVECSEPNDGEIVDSVTDKDYCPDEADAYIEDDAVVWCIDEDA